MVAGRFVGQSVQRKEDPRLVSGHGRYVDDVRLPGLVHAAFVRSHIARGRIVSVQTEAARQLPGVRAVYLASDLDELTVGPLLATMYLNAPIPSPVALARGDVRYAGQPVAVVLADSRYLAEDGCDLVEVEYDPETPVLDMELAAGADVLVHPERGSNVVSEARRWDDELSLAIHDALHVMTRTYRQPRQSHTPMETHGVIASWDAFDGELRIWCTSQRVHEVRATMGRVTGIAEQRIHVVQRDVGGGFGQKGSMRPEEIAAVLASCRSGLPVKWIEDRQENLVAGGHARADRITVTMGLTKTDR
jgi:aerobic carbon-monoxide dehydrogenase large subunit